MGGLYIVNYLIPWKIKKTMTFLGAEQSVFRLFQVNNDDVRSITGPPPTATSSGGVAASFVGTGSNNLSPFMQIYCASVCLCVCVGGEQTEGRVPGRSASRCSALRR